MLWDAHAVVVAVRGESGSRNRLAQRAYKAGEHNKRCCNESGVAYSIGGASEDTAACSDSSRLGSTHRGGRWRGIHLQVLDGFLNV